MRGGRRCNIEGDGLEGKEVDAASAEGAGICSRSTARVVLG